MDVKQTERQIPFSPLTSDEIRTLRECNKQAFYNRCLPISGLGMLALGYGINAGYLKKNFLIGKIVGVGFLGYVIGKISYISKCREMILSLPNSPLADKIKKNEDGNFMMKEIAVFPTFEESGKAKRSDLNLDHNFDQGEKYKGLDDSFRPSLDNEFKMKKPLIMEDGGKNGITYKDLRQKNRAEYDLANRGSIRPNIDQSSAQLNRPSPSNRSSHEEMHLGKASQNRYGDVVME